MQHFIFSLIHGLYYRVRKGYAGHLLRGSWWSLDNIFWRGQLVGIWIDLDKGNIYIVCHFSSTDQEIPNHTKKVRKKQQSEKIENFDLN